MALQITRYRVLHHIVFDVLQHLVVPGGHPSNYKSGPVLLNFSDQPNPDEVSQYFSGILHNLPAWRGEGLAVLMYKAVLAGKGLAVLIYAALAGKGFTIHYSLCRSETC